MVEYLISQTNNICQNHFSSVPTLAVNNDRSLMLTEVDPVVEQQGDFILKVYQTFLLYVPAH